MDFKLNQTTPHDPTPSREINTINLEQTEPLVEHTLGQSHSTLSSGKSESISDPGSITTTELFTKPIVFAPNLEWSVDQTVNTNIYTASLLDIFESLRLSPGGQSLRAHAFFRSGARIQIKLTSSPFHAGKLVLYYIPPGVTATYRESIFAKVQYPCVYVDAGNSTTGELDIPFVAIKDFFATQNPNRYSDFGDIGVAVFNKLAIGTGGQTTINLALSLHPTQNQIALPVLAHDIDITIQAAAIAGIVGEALLGDVTSLLSAAGAAAGGVAIEKGVEKMIGADVQKVSLSQNDLDRMSQMNKNNTSSTKDLNVSAPSLSNMVGLGTEHLSLYPEVTYVKHPVRSNPVDDEMDIQRIARVPSLLATRNWANDTTPGSILFRTNVDPMSVPSSARESGNYTIYPTYLSHITHPFAYWRGSIDYHFTFASTEQHKGKVIAAWIPFNTTRDNISIIDPTPTVETLSLFPNEIFDLSLNKEFVFSVPYNSETPYRLVSVFNPTTLVSDTSTVIDDSSTENSLGTLVLMVYNRLSNPTTVTPTIQFNVYIRAGTDYQVRGLRLTQDPGNQIINYVTLQSLNIATESSRGGMLMMPENRVGRTNAHVSETSFQDDSSEHHLSKLLSKYYPQIGVKFTLAANTARMVQVANAPGLTVRGPRVLTQRDPRWRNLINHFRDIYAFWHGSLNYFAIHNSTVNTPVLLTASHNPTTSTDGVALIPSPRSDNNTSYALIDTVTYTTDNVDLSETSVYSHMSNLRVNPTIEITTPYRSLYRRLYTRDSIPGPAYISENDESAGSLDLIYSNPSATDIPVSVMFFQSVGSDFRFKYLIPPPSLRMINAI